MRNLFANVCLLLVSCVAGLVLCEVSLRFFYPKYRHLAEAPFRSDARRIWARTPNHRDVIAHPDTGLSHALYHNNLALRQHRNFSEADLAAAINIGFFGDSFTENTGMAAPYSFTEPLDYLLNQSGNRFNVLNFGVDGYGPGQSLLHYESFRYAEDLDHVFYVYSENDSTNIYETGLFHLDEAGLLVRNEEIRDSWWTPLIRRLTTSYLVLDAGGVLSSVLAERAENLADRRRLHRRRQSDETQQALHRAYGQGNVPENIQSIFRQLIRYWKHLVEHRGATFSVVLLANTPPEPFIVDLLNAEAVEIVDLYACFRDYDPAYLQQPGERSPYHFKRDGHWNEAGNRLAAVCLYRFLEEKILLPSLFEDRLREVIDRYYGAFDGETLLKAGGGGEIEESNSLETIAAIREKYLSLDISSPLKDFWEDIIEVGTQPTKRIIASDFNVYFDRNQLFYVKEDKCRQAGREARFFLHIIPVDERDLHAFWRQYGFESISFSRVGLDLHTGQCVVRIRLPTYPIRQIRTGQFVKDDQGNYQHLWEGKSFMDRASEERKTD